MKNYLDDFFQNSSSDCKFFKSVIHEKIGIEYQHLKLCMFWDIQLKLLMV